MASDSEVFHVAFTHHQAGQLREAEAIYRQILQADPNHVESLHLLGLVAYQVGQPQAAVELIGRAVALRGDRAVFHANLGEAYRVLGKASDAEQCLLRALRLDSSLPDAHNSLGNLFRASGRITEALAAYRQAIRVRPDFAEAHNNLGTVLQAQGERAEAIAEYQHALRFKPDYVEACNNLGTAFKENGDLAQAAQCYRRALELAPRNGEAHVNLGTVHQAQQQFDEAIACYRRALAIDPRSALAHNNLGAALKELERFDEAIASFREALRVDPDSFDAHFNLGATLHAREDWAGAGSEYKEALRIKPDDVKALTSLGNVLQHQGRMDESLQLYERAIQLDPTIASAHLNRANAYRVKRMTAEAIAGYNAALRLQPNFPEAYNNLAVLFNDVDQSDLAIECCRKGIEQDPTGAALFANLATAMQTLGRLDEAVEYARKSVDLRPEGVEGYTNLLYKLNFNPAFDPPTIFAEHLEWARRHAEPLTALAAPHTNDRSPRRRLRVGYVSPNFREHAVNFFTEPLIAAHDHREFEIFCYSDVTTADAATERLRRAADHWRDVAYDSDQQLADRVRADAIDILVDLTGHIAGNRLLVFARKPAPIQVTYIGYQNTTGMSAMDYRLTDAWADPPGVTDAYYTEELVRLPRSFFCYRPSDDSPPITPLPARETGRITFGSFNNFAKVGPRVVDTWLEILERVPDSRLLVLARGGGSLQDRIAALADARGVDPTRIEFRDKRPREAYLQLLREADIALDPFPFNGHTTTCDLIWMGVPVVMLAGQTYASRFGGSVLRNVGLEHLIADTSQRYIALAVALAADLPQLAQWRDALRPRMADSALLDFQGFTHNVEAAYRQMWLTWCRQAKSGADI